MPRRCARGDSGSRKAECGGCTLNEPLGYEREAPTGLPLPQRPRRLAVVSLPWPIAVSRDRPVTCACAVTSTPTMWALAGVRQGRHDKRITRGGEGEAGTTGRSFGAVLVWHTRVRAACPDRTFAGAT